MPHPYRTCLFFIAFVALNVTALADDFTITPAKPDAAGILAHDVTSPYQAGTTQIRVLHPDHLDAAKRIAVIYVLPVEARMEHRFGDGMIEVKKNDLANKLDVLFVEPIFSHLPWYADNPTRPAIRQESYLLKVVLPFVEKTYAVKAESSGRLLVGFSKSGWGAYSLLLRHPDLFARAAAWDAPLMMDRPGKYGSGPIFETQQNFDDYCVSKLLERRTGDLRDGKRLILLGYGNFHEEHRQAHALMQKLNIDHEYVDGPERKHEWGSGWLPEAAAALLAPPAK
jgi:hypothetical protein